MSRFPVIRFSKLANFACKRPFCRSVFAKWPGMTSYFLVRFYLKTVKKTELLWTYGTHVPVFGLSADWNPLPLLARCIQAFPGTLQSPRMDQLCPPSFLCPIGREVMRDPVMCADGHSYERTAIATWLQSHATSPNTNLPLAHLLLVPNIALRNSIEEWVQQTSAAVETLPASHEVSVAVTS